MDVPHANLLRHLPRAMKFMESAILGKEKGTVYVHCVHGQSRSCAACVAYLMRQTLQAADGQGSLSSDFPRSGLELLQSCYNSVQWCRSCMTINPGFVRQLDLFRRMGCGLLRDRTRHTASSVRNQQPPLSRAYASFRSFRAKGEFHEHSTVLFKFQVPVSANDLHSIINAKSVCLFRCKKCRTNLFCSLHILDEWTETSKLPFSEYWVTSAGGKEYTSIQASIGKRDSVKLTKDGSANCVEVEPMEWMRSQMADPETGLMFTSGKLNCPSCGGKIGSWDWNYPELISSTFIQTSKVDNN